jgi:hypothetical protein
LTPGTVLKLPIDIPKEYISLYGTLPPRLKSIASPNPDSVYGTGDIIDIDLEFTIDVLVSGTPSLTLNTGCDDASCETKEIQTFSCAADRGKFAVRLEDQFLMNVESNCTKEELKKKLEEFDGVNRVTVTYSDSDDRKFSGGNRVCSSRGNTVTVTFDNVSFPQYNGDVPLLQFDATNTYAHLRSGLNMGEDDSFLGGVPQHSRRYTPNVTAAVEVVRGVQQRDGTAYYVSGSGTNTIRFKFIAQNGDFTERLEVKALDFAHGYLYSPVTHANVSTAVPAPQAGPRYMTQAASALGFKHHIRVTSAQPQIIAVTSPDTNGVYTEGDELSIHVVYDLAVKVYGEQAIALQLSTGAFDRMVPYSHMVSPYILAFAYTVQEGDRNIDLDVAGATALNLNGGVIYRDTTTNETLANTTLPVPGSVSSLSYNKDLAINTLSPQIVQVHAVSRTGTYTAGDLIDFEVLYGNPIYVQGTPRLLIENTVRQMDVEIRAAPYAPDVSYTRAQPGEVAQTIVTLSVNWDLATGDQVRMNMPGFSLRDPSGSDSNRTLVVSAKATLADATVEVSGTAKWLGDRSILEFTTAIDVPRSAMLSITIAGSSGLIAPPAGVRAVGSDLTFSIVSPDSVEPALVDALPFDFVAPIGFESLSLTINPPAQGAALQLSWQFSVPETLVEGDEISLFLPGFLVQNETLLSTPSVPSVDAAAPHFNYTWYPNASEFRVQVTSTASAGSRTIRVSDYVRLTLPSSGVDASTALVSASMESNGQFVNIPVTDVTKVCAFQPGTDGVPHASVSYRTKRAGAASAATFAWTAGPFDLLVGDSVVFRLPAYDASLPSGVRVLMSQQVSGTAAKLFAVTIEQRTVTFTAITTVSANSAVKVTIDATAGLMVPLTGLRSGVEYFRAKIVSTQCQMKSQKFTFPAGELVIPVTSATLAVVPSTPALGDHVALSVRFALATALATDDSFSVTIPGFSRNVLFDPYNATFWSNADVSMRFNRGLERLEFTLQSDFNSAHTATEVQLYVNRSSGFAVPVEGVPADAFKLSIHTAAEGTVFELPMTGPCLGFCTSSAMYSTHVASEPVVLTVELSYSDPLAVLHDLIFDIAGLAQSASTTLSAYVSTSSSARHAAIPTLISGALHVPLPVGVTKRHPFTVEIHGLQLLAPGTGPHTPSVYTTAMTNSTLQGTPRTALSYPAWVLPSVYFDVAELTFSNTGAVNASVMNLVFGNPAGQNLVAGNYVVVTLPGFDLDLTGNAFSLGDTVDIASSSWDKNSSILRLTLARLLSSTEDLKLTVSDIKLPTLGVSSNATYNGIAYSIGLGSASQQVTAPRPFTAVQEVVRIGNPSVQFTFDSSAHYALHTITVAFTLGAELDAPSVLSIALPGLTMQGAALNDDTTQSVSFTSTSVSGAGVWFQNTSSIVVDITSYASARTHVLTFDASSASVIVGTTGVAAGADATLALHRAASVLATGAAPMPCAGVCSVAITPCVRKAGYATDFAFNIVLGSHTFGSQDTLTVTLGGFTKKKTTSMLIVGAANSGAVGVNVTMLADSTDLTITLAANNSVGTAFSHLEFTLPQTFVLQAPTAGIRAVDTFAVTWAAAARGTGYAYASTVAQVLPIGKLLRSSMEVTPPLPGAAAEVAFTFEFADALAAGDFMRIYLPSFEFPAGVLAQVPSATLGRSTTLVEIVGDPAATEELVGVDESVYQLRHMGYLQVNILEDVPAREAVHFVIRNSSLLRVPRAGVYRDTVPWVSVSSASSPVTAVQLQNYTRVGSLAPAAIVVQATPMAVASNLELTFNVNCPLFTGDHISVYVPNLILTVGASQRMDVTASRDVHFDAVWVPQTASFNLTLIDNTYILAGPLSLHWSLRGFNISTDAVYADAAAVYTYAVQSELCPVPAASFDTSAPVWLSESAVLFNPFVKVSEPTVVFLSLQPVTPLPVGSVVTWVLPDFRVSTNGVLNETTAHHLVNVTNSAPFESNVLVSYDDITHKVSIAARVSRLTAQGSPLQLVVPATDLLSVVVPAHGIHHDTHKVTVAAYREAAGTGWAGALSPRVSSLIFSARVKDVRSVFYFLHVAIALSSPAPSQRSAVTIEWILSQPMEAGWKVVVVLPGFTNAVLSSAEETEVTVSGPDGALFNASWDPTESAVVFYAQSVVPRLQTITLTMLQSAGFVCPSQGIPHASATYTIAVKPGNMPLFRTEITDVTVVPVILSSAVQFIASTEDRSYETEGDPYIMQLRPGHPLNSLDAGAQVVISNAFYTIQDVRDNLLYLVEPYHGVRVFMGYPAVPVYTPPYRFANFASGSTTSSLIFRYRVRRDDLSLSLRVFQPTDAYNTNNATQSLDLNGGQLLRNSDNPRLIADIAIPAYVTDTARSVNTDAPGMKAFFTTTPSGMYSVGQKIDFHVQYNYSVTVENLEFSRPALLLKVATFGLVKARYSSGSGTDTIVFVYTVSPYDFQDRIGSDQITTDAPIYQPLRVITGNQLNSLRRTSDLPLVDADFNFPLSSGLEVNFPVNISLVGAAEKVHKVWTPLDIINNNFSAGDAIQVMVTFTGPVSLQLANTSVPRLLLDVGRSAPGEAVYASQYNGTTLTFVYEVNLLDELSHGLYLTCTCADYFKRTFVDLDGSRIVGTDGLRASVVLANTSTHSELRVDDPRGNGIRIDRAVPHVLQVYSNLSYHENVAYSPGTVALISVQFNLRVTVRGIVRMWLDAQSAPCPARYYSGNNTAVLNFLYMVTEVSGISRLDYTSVDALDVSDGQILRYSDRPQIIADTKLPRPGLQQSLGVRSTNIIDTTPVSAVALRPSEPQNAGQAYFAAHSLSLSLYRLGAGAFQYLSQPERRATVPLSYLYENSSVQTVVSRFESYFHDALEEYGSIWATAGVNYTRLVLDDSSEEAFEFTPQLRSLVSRQAMGLDSYWWTDLQVRSSVELQMQLSRAAVLEGSFIEVNTGKTLNRAFSQLPTHTYFLTVVSDNPYAAGSEQQRYRLSYGGYRTRCISVTADAKSESSIQQALLEIPALFVLEPNVVRLQTRQEGSKVLTYYRIDFQHLPAFVLEAMAGGALGESCALPAADGAVILLKENSTVTFEYPIRGASSILLQATDDLPVGTYTVNVDESSGVTVSADGIAPQSVQFERFTVEGAPVSKATIWDGSYVPRVRRSALAFGSDVPGNKSSLTVSLCFEPALRVSDVVSVSLPGFGAVNSGLTMHYTASTGNEVAWSAATSTLFITVLDADVDTCITETIDENRGLLLPQTSIFRNDGATFTFSVRDAGASASSVRLENTPFELVRPVGIAAFSVSLSDTRPNYWSDVQVVFEIAADGTYTPEDTSLSVFLPGFYSVGRFSGELALGGPYAAYFDAEWFNSTNEVVLRPTASLQKGVYNVTILAKEPLALYVPARGMHTENQPSFSFNSALWSSDITLVNEYPSVYGYNSSSLTLTMTSDASVYDVQGLTFQAMFTRAIAGPATITLELPFLTTKVQKIVLPVDSSEYDSIIWRNWQKTLTIHRTEGWEGPLVTVALHSLADFVVNERGVPENHTHAGINFAVKGGDGELRSTGIIDVTPVPRIVHSSLQLSTYGTDIFNTTQQVYTIEMELNTPARTFDSFYIDIEGMSQLNATNAGIAERCLSLNWTGPHSTGHTIAVYLNNNTHCKHETRFLRWHITELVPGDAALRSIAQYKTDGFTVSWDNPLRYTKNVQFDEVPTLGITYSAIDLATPRAGHTSDVNIRILTASNLRTGDIIRLALPGFRFNWTSTVLADNFGRQWPTAFTDDDVLVLVAPTTLPPTALEFVFESEFAAVLPVGGIPAPVDSAYWNNFAHGPGNITIGLQRGDLIVQPQPVRRVTPVGRVLAFDLRPIRTMKYDAKAGTAVSSVRFNLALETLSPLRAGDVVTLVLSQYSFQYDEELTLPEEFRGSYRAHAYTDGNRIEITTTYDVNSTQLVLEMLATNAVHAGAGSCNQLAGECPVYVSVQSTSNPVHRQRFDSQEVFMLANAQIKFYETLRNPTPYPTSLPSNQPSGQPSSSPTRQPSSQPTRAPVRDDPTSQPSTQPSSSPTTQPSGSPTSQPSEQPSGSPTNQPSTQPSSMPTSPTSQPSTQPSSQSTFQPSSNPTMPTSQPSAQPTNPTSMPSCQPSTQPSSEPSKMPSAQPLAHPSSQPSSQPSGSPTTQPSSHPSTQPSAQPSAQPSRHPSSQPTSQPSMAPTGFASDFVLVMELTFTLQNALPEGAIMAVSAPNIYSNLTANYTTAIGVVQQFVSVQETWGVIWLQPNQTFQIVARVDVAPGDYFIQLISDDVELTRTILYENDPNITYAVEPYPARYDSTNVTAGYLPQSGQFGQVHSYGMKNATLELSNYLAGEVSAVTLRFEADDTFRWGDRIKVQLPGFALWENISSLTAVTENSLSVTWDVVNSSATIHVLAISATLDVELRYLRTPIAGSNAFVNQPLVSFYNSATYRKFVATPFRNFVGMAHRPQAIVTFGSALAGQLSDVTIALSTPLYVEQYDVLSLYLPQFWSTQPTLTAVWDGGAFSAAWDVSAESVRIVAQEAADLASLTITVKGLRLPVDGVTEDMSQLVALSCNSTRSGRFVPGDLSIERVGYVTESALSYVPARVDGVTQLSLSFALSIPLAQNESVVFHLPGFGMTGATPAVYTISPVTARFDGRWNSAAGFLVLTAQNDLSAYTLHTVLVNSSVTLPSTGIFVDQYGATTDRVMYTVGTSAAAGRIDPTEIHHTQLLGLSNALVAYDRVRDAADAASLRIDFQCSVQIEVGDELRVQAPLLVAPTAVSSYPLTVYGDLAEDAFVAPFSAHFNTSGQEIVLVATETIPPRAASVFVSKTSGLLFTSSSARYGSPAHRISGTIASIGTLATRPIPHTPKHFFAAAPGSLNVTRCSTGDAGCAWSFEFDLQSPLKAGESLAISHPSLRRTLNPALRANLSSITSLALNISGSAAPSLLARWREADHTSHLEVTSHGISLTEEAVPTSAVHSHGTALADISWYGLNTTLPAGIVRDQIALVSSIPQVKSVYAVHDHSVGAVLACRDTVDVVVEFTEPVIVFHPQYLRILLNTREMAAYKSGNASTLLTFTYRVTEPVDVASLEVLGPGALEYSFSAPSQILKFQRPPDSSASSSGTLTIPANLTIPAPYGPLLLLDGAFRALSVQCDAWPVVTLVAASTKRFATYATGDVLDVEVRFDRAIGVLGTPKLRLMDDSGDPPMFVARYVNVSRVQWLELPSDGVLALTHTGERTPCIATNDAEGIVDALSDLSSLQLSLPITVTTFAARDGWRYRLQFGGLAPFVLQQERLSCARNEITALVTVDPFVLNSAFFRYEVQEGDEASLLSYNTTGAIVLASGDLIFTAGSASHRSVDATLPAPSSTMALAQTSGVTLHTAAPYVISVTSTAGGGSALQSGDTVPIVVTFSAPVTVTGTVELELKFTSTLFDSPPCCTVRVPLQSSSGAQLHFLYAVQMGDYAHYLSTSTANELFLTGSVLLTSMQPSTAASLTLPASGAANALDASMVSIDASTLPVVLSVFTNHSHGVFNAGEEVFITIRFSADVDVLSTDASAAPHITLTSPSGAHMTYAEGTGGRDIAFLYVVGPGETTNNVTFGLDLLSGMFRDPFQRKFANLTSSNGVTYYVDGIRVDTAPVTVLSVNSDDLDGTYYPGDILDVYVVFSEPVLVLSNGATPSLELLLPSQLGVNLLAHYASGNGTAVIHFTYVVPPPNIQVSPQAPVRLDYANTDALYKHLNGARITDVSTHPTTDVSVFLPSMDLSPLGDKRQIYIDFTFAEVVGVSAVSSDGVYTAGDEVLIEVAFTSRVMVIHPPVLKLAVGAVNRSAIYHSGNFTHSLYFKYTVQLKDTSSSLDYIDTRRPPYGTEIDTLSFALNTAVEPSLELLTDTVVGVFMQPTDFGGVFMASAEPGTRVPAYTALSLPGAVGSLSAASDIVIDTTAPYITEVTVPISSGTYGVGVAIPIVMRFSTAVVVHGCPRILLQINGVDKFATFVGGSGTDTLYFQYVVQSVDGVFNFDYLDRFSLRLAACNATQLAAEASRDVPPMSIMRKSLHPMVFANLTMPWVNYIESVIAPVSITGSGKYLNLVGSANAPRLVWTSVDNDRSYALGDVVDINVGFTSQMLFPDRSYVLAADSAAAVELSRVVRFGAQVNGTTVRLPLVVQHQETVTSLSYADQFSLITESSCAIIDVPSRDCTAQNLPVPFAYSRINSVDALSPKHIAITRPQVTVTSMAFNDSMGSEAAPVYLTGQVINITVEFNDPVTVLGRPAIVMDLQGSDFPIYYARMVTSSTLLFQAQLDTTHFQGKLVCSRDAGIDLNGGAVYRTANFLPVLQAELQTDAICCLETCQVLASVISRRPVVERVHSPQSGVFSTGEKIEVYVQFSAPLLVLGTPALVLDLPGRPSAQYTGLSADHLTLGFRYAALATDYTSALDCLSPQALSVPRVDLYDGVYLRTAVSNVTADLTLPQRGAAGSLGRETNIIINKDRPNLVAALALPARATSGDDLLIIMRYSEAMAAVDANGRDVFQSGDLDAGRVSLGMRILLQPTVVTSSNPVQARTATLRGVNGTDVVFVYQVTANDPSGAVYFSSATPLLTNNVILRSALSGTAGPIEFPASIAATALASIDNANPTVVQVFSPNTSSLFPFGVGDVIDIYVEMTLAVVIVETPQLQMLLNDRATGVAQYVPNGQASVKVLHFQYNVRVGDSADPLEYNGRFALTGHLLRYSTRNPAIVADLELPEPAGLGSLGYCCNVVIDSEPPFVESLIPLKRAGIYGENEVIYIMARFTKPVVVTGVPHLLLTISTSVTDVSNVTVGVASYASTVDEYDIPIDIRVTDVLFEYVVQRYDNVISLHHTDEYAIVVPSGASIKHKTNSPTLAADISLRHPDDHEPISDRVYRQWKFRYPATVEVLLRDLYHTKPSAITATVDHLGHINTLFSGCCTGNTFGNSYPKTRSGTNATLLNVDTGVGADFLFSDTVAPNLALAGIVSQSTPRLSPKLAIDGNVDPLLGDGSVSDTADEQDAWWLLQLPANSRVRSMAVYARKPQAWINPITEVVIKSFDAYPQGRYKLRLNNIHPDDPSVEVTTGFIDFGASPVVVQRIIEATSGLGNVAVTRRALPLCDALVGQGCGSGYQSGYGFAYRLSFLSLAAPSPNVTVVSVRFPGQPDVLVEGAAIEVQLFQLFTSVELIRTGYFIQVPEENEYGKGVAPPVVNDTTANTGFNYNAWLTPFWVMVFNTTAPPSALNASINASIWVQRYETMGDLLNINLPEAMAVGYIKIQREGYGSLSLAEVEVYEEKINQLNSYDQGAPVEPSALSAPYQPSQSFKHTFNHVPFDGRWLVQLTQDATLQRDYRGFSGAAGTISEAVLIITDLAGVVHSYYQDLRAEVTSLPKYGDLSYTAPHTPSPYGNWRENFEVTAEGRLVPKLGGERPLGYCYGPDSYFNASTQNADNVYQQCPDNFGVAPLLSTLRVLGDTPETVYLRNERVVVYKPRQGYLGPDYFTYIVHDGQNVQTHEVQGSAQGSQNEVTVHVRKCRPYTDKIKRGLDAKVSPSFAADGSHLLCQCAQTEISQINNRTICDAARVMVCSSSANNDTVNSRDHFKAMCLTCTDPRRGLLSGECQTQTIRAVSLLTSRGLCRATKGPTATPFMDCSAETATEPGREATNYLSSKPPLLTGSFQKLMNSFGAYGWYHTPLLT